jgi:D-3-phosphoglycerate dehydrogenase
VSEAVGGSRPPVVVVSQRLGGIGAEERRIEAAGAELRSAPLWTHEEIAEHGGGVDIILAGAVEPFDATALSSLPELRLLVRRGVGVDNVDVEAATRLGILVANVPDASVEEVSDHALSLLLALERRIVPLDAAVHGGTWQRDPSGIARVRAPIRRLSELTLGIAGFGRIGRALARKARPIYGRLLIADPLVDDATAAAEGATLVTVDELLAGADHLSLHAPLLPSTHHLIDAAALERIRPGAILVNTSRGGLVDEAALIAALRDGRLAAAGLDVTEREPLPADDPLLGAERLVLTAHSAASSITAGAELARRSVDAIVDVLDGRLPASVVDPAVLAVSTSRVAGLRPHGA